MTQQYPQQPQGYGGQYQGYNNQYYQNYYAQQQPVDTHADKPESKQHANKKFVIVIGAIALVVILFVGAFFFLQRQGETDTAPAIPSVEEEVLVPAGQQLAQVEIEEVKLCSFIDENYNCNEKPGGEFDQGEDVYLYVKVAGFEQIQTKEGYLFGLEESIETVNPEGAVIDPLTGTAIDISDFADQKKDSLLFRNKIPNLYLFNPGEHTVTLSLRDKVTGLVAKKTLSFVVKGL